MSEIQNAFQRLRSLLDHSAFRTQWQSTFVNLYILGLFLSESSPDLPVKSVSPTRRPFATLSSFGPLLNFFHRSSPCAKHPYRVLSFFVTAPILKMAAELGWSDEKSSSFYLGYFISNVPAGYATDRFGGRRVMIGGAFFCSSLTLLTPSAAKSSFSLLIIVRVLLGASDGFCWPAAHALLGRWFPTSERGRAVAFLNSGAFIGNLLTIAIAPPLITASGWPVSVGCLALLAWRLVHSSCVSDGSILAHHCRYESP